MKLISIITPSFNRAYIIDETAQSIFAQTDPNWEWIIVDDGSTDESWEKLLGYARHDQRVQVFRRDRAPKGACTCRNIGVEKSNGEYLMFLDTDDLISPDCIEKRHEWIKNQSNKTIPFGETIVFEGTPNEGFWWDDANNPVSWLSGLFTSAPPCQGTAPLWKRADFLKIGGWNEGLRVWQDVELHIRAYARGLRFEKVQAAKPDVFLRLSPDSISHVGFHSAEKLLSRWEVVSSVMEQFKPADFTDNEARAFQRMVLSVHSNAINTKSWKLADQVALASHSKGFISKTQKDWMQFRKQLRRAKIDRIPFTISFLEFKSKQIFPISSLRKLGSIKWSQKI